MTPSEAFELTRGLPAQSDMSANTIAENKRSNRLSAGDEVWLFGYGSLIFKVDFPYVEARPATIKGWSRRFWQGSHDHRGNEENPGRVVTLIEEPAAFCGGLAFKVDAAVFAQLDVREKNGYLRITTALEFGEGKSAQGLVYIATKDNEAFLGEASEQEIARQVFKARGESGPNDEYVLKLAESLRELNLEDDHVFEIERYLKQLAAN